MCTSWSVGDLGSGRDVCGEIEPTSGWRQVRVRNSEQLSTTSGSGFGSCSVHGWSSAAKIASEGYEICYLLVFRTLLFFYLYFILFSILLLLESQYKGCGSAVSILSVVDQEKMRQWVILPVGVNALSWQLGDKTNT